MGPVETMFENQLFDKAYTVSFFLSFSFPQLIE